MSKRWHVLFIATLSVSMSSARIAQAQSPQSATAEHSAVGGPSLLFVENVGQFAEGALFQVRGGDRTMWLTQDGIWITILEAAQPEALSEAHESSLELHVRGGESAREDQPRAGVNLKLSFPGSNPLPQLEPFGRLETHVSYFLGSDPAGWHADVPVWGGVRYVNLYPGIDLEVSGENGQIVQRAVCHRGADVSAVRLRVEGAGRVALDGQRMRVSTAVGTLTLPLLTVEGALPGTAPTAFTTAPGVSEVKSPFASAWPASYRVAAAAGAADLAYSFFLGGSEGDGSTSVAVDGSGAAYVTGTTRSFDFPTTPGAFDTTYANVELECDAFVAKLNPDGSALVYSTFLGGSASDYTYAIAVDGSESAYVTGYTYSRDFPTTPDAFDTTFKLAFVTKLNATGTALSYSTFLGGSGDYGTDKGYGIAVDGSGSAYVVGETLGYDFPTTPGAFDENYTSGCGFDAFLVKLGPTGSALAYGTYLGGTQDETAFGVAVTESGVAFVTGQTSSSDFPTTEGAFDRSPGEAYAVFLVGLNPAGHSTKDLTYATFVGESGCGSGIAVDGSGAAYITGYTASSDFPTTPGALDRTHNGSDDGFIVKLNPAGNGIPDLLYSTFLGGSMPDYSRSVALDGSGSVYVTGYTESFDFPTTPGALDTTHSGSGDGFVVRMSAVGNGTDDLLYSTFLGGKTGEAITVDGSGAVYVTGNAGGDAFVAKLQMRSARSDIDGDGRTDLGVYGVSSGDWWILESSTDNSEYFYRGGWGGIGYEPVSGDYDGDGKLDLVAYGASTGDWWILLSSSDYVDYLHQAGWGGSGFTPVEGDYDGDGRADLAVYDTASGDWWIRLSGSDYADYFYRGGWGAPGYDPVPSDYDGDGKTDLAVQNEASGDWWILQSGSDYTTYFYRGGWGAPGYRPVPGDYDGDGKADLAVYGTTTGDWWVLESGSDYMTHSFRGGWGAPDYDPVPGDYDGDGKTDLAVQNEASGDWWILESGGDYSTYTYRAGWGGPGYEPL